MWIERNLIKAISYFDHWSKQTYFPKPLCHHIPFIICVILGAKALLMDTNLQLDDALKNLSKWNLFIIIFFNGSNSLHPYNPFVKGFELLKIQKKKMICKILLQIVF